MFFIPIEECCSERYSRVDAQCSMPLVVACCLVAMKVNDVDGKTNEVSIGRNRMWIFEYRYDKISFWFPLHQKHNNIKNNLSQHHDVPHRKSNFSCDSLYVREKSLLIHQLPYQKCTTSTRNIVIYIYIYKSQIETLLYYHESNQHDKDSPGS